MQAGLYGQERILELRTGLYEGLSSLVGFVLVEVLDEPSGKILGFLLPLGRIGVGVARIEDPGIDSFEDCRNGEVEVRDLLGRGGIDAVVEDGVDDSTGVTDGDTLSGTVPASVDQIGLCSALLHLLDEFLGILGWVQFEECLSEAGGESRSRFGDSALGSC